MKIYPPGFADWTQTEYSVTTPQWLRRAIDEALGVVIIDRRPAEAVTAGHIRGAVNIPASEFGASRARFPSDTKAPIVLYGDDSEQAAQQLIDWGYRAVRVLPIDFARWASAGYPVETGPTNDAIVYDPKPKPGAIRLSEFSRLAKTPDDEVLLVDLRNEYELWAPTIAHAVNIPFDQLNARMDKLSADQLPIFFCPTGARAEMAYNLLAQAGKPSRFLEVGAAVDADGNVRVTRR